MTDNAIGTPGIPRGEAGLWQAIAAQGRVLVALILREIRTRHGNTVFGYLQDLMEMPIILLAMLLMFTLTGRQSPYGDNIALFLITGVLPFYMVKKTATKGMGSVKRAGTFKRMMPVTPLDTGIAAMTVNFLTYTLILLGFLGVLAAFKFSSDAIPYAPQRVIEGFGVAMIFTYGLGIINGVVSFFAPTWTFIFGLLMRPMIFTSGIFYIPEEMPRAMIDIIKWNPLLHIIAWIRTGFYETYPTFILDRSFAVTVAIGTLLFGLTLDRAARRRFGRKRKE